MKKFLFLFTLCALLISCKTFQRSTDETADASLSEAMLEQIVMVLFDDDDDYYYIFDFYYIPEPRNRIPTDYVLIETIEWIEVLDWNTTDERVIKLGIDTRRKVVLMELSEMVDALRTHEYVTRVPKSSITKE